MLTVQQDRTVIKVFKFPPGGPATLVFSYLSDLVGPKKRQLYLSVVGMSFIVAWLILPGKSINYEVCLTYN